MLHKIVNYSEIEERMEPSISLTPGDSACYAVGWMTLKRHTTASG